MLATTAAVNVPVPPALPNIVFIMVDDLGYGELGAYGQQKIRTPHLDGLAAEGMKFTRAYAASPVCAPTRASLLTGKHQGHAAIRGNKEQGGFAPEDREGQFPLPKSEITLAEVLKTAGYRTGLVGKWGLGGSAPDEHPLAHGFDHFYGYLCQRRAHSHYPPYLWNDHSVVLMPGNRIMNPHQRIAEPLASEEEYAVRFGGRDYSGEKLMDASVRFIRENRTRPFFLYYAPILPHLALQAPQEYVDRYPREWDVKPYLGEAGYVPNPRPRATYAAMIEYLDMTVGAIVAEIEKHGLRSNTLIVFTSDNGATFSGGVDREFFNSNGGLRGAKMSLYEGGIRVPMIASWPGRIEKGSVSDQPVATYDTLATFAELTKAKAPRNDGTSYLPALLGKPMKARSHLYFEYPEADSMQAVIFGDLKAIRPKLKADSSRIEIYDLKADPAETRDLASARPDLAKRALEVMRREHVPNPNFPLPGVDKTP